MSCTESGASWRTQVSSCRRTATWVIIRSWITSAAGPFLLGFGTTTGFAGGSRSPTARKSFEGLSDRRTPSVAIRSNAFPSSDGLSDSSSTSASRQVSGVRPGAWPLAGSVDTRSSASSASTSPRLPWRRWTRRSVRIVTTCARTWSRTRPATTLRRATGGVRTARPRGTAISSRAPSIGSFRCHPASSPPVRRRRTTPASASARSGVSKYVATSCCSTVDTEVTPFREERSGSTLDSSRSYLSSTSR